MADYRDKYDVKNAQRYEAKTYQDEGYYSWMWEIEKRYLGELLNKHKFKDYLDFACGTGRVISFVEDYVDNSTGVDVSENILDIARGKVSKSRLIRQDVTQKSLNRKFDLVTAFRFFLNAQDDLRHDVMKELQSITRDKSWVIVSNQGNKTSLRFVFENLEGLLLKTDFNLMSKGDFIKLFEPYGFGLVEYRGIGFLPKPLYRIKAIKKPLQYLDLLFYKLRIFSYFSHNQILVFEKLPNK